MRVCVPCGHPGGPDATINGRFEGTDVLDYYELEPDGRFEHLATMRNCGGAACIDPVEAIAHRGAKAIIVMGLGPGSLLRLHGSGIVIFKAKSPVVGQALAELASGKLDEITIEDFPRVSGAEK